MCNGELKKICSQPVTEPITAQVENDRVTTSTTLSSDSYTSDLIRNINETDSAQPTLHLALCSSITKCWDSDKSDSENNNRISEPETELKKLTIIIQTA